MRVIITNDSGQVLLVRNWIGQQLWALPGGGLRARESATDAARRELKEEIGLEVPAEVVQHLAAFDHTDTGLGIQWRIELVRVRLNRGQSLRRNRFELIDMRWYDVAKLPEASDPLVRRALSTVSDLKFIA